MPRYLEVAAEANEVAKRIMAVPGIAPDDRPMLAELLARLVNLGIRCSPRGVQHTVRLNAVRAAVRGLPVRVSMVEKTDERTNRTYNALVTQQIVTGKPNAPATVDGPDEE